MKYKKHYFKSLNAGPISLTDEDDVNNDFIRKVICLVFDTGKKAIAYKVSLDLADPNKIWIVISFGDDLFKNSRKLEVLLRTENFFIKHEEFLVEVLRNHCHFDGRDIENEMITISRNDFYNEMASSYERALLDYRFEEYPSISRDQKGNDLTELEKIIFHEHWPIIKNGNWKKYEGIIARLSR